MTIRDLIDNLTAAAAEHGDQTPVGYLVVRPGDSALHIGAPDPATGVLKGYGSAFHVDLEGAMT